MNQDHHRKADAEPCSIKRPIESEKSRKAEKKLELEEGEEKRLGLCQQEDQRSEGTKALGPRIRLWLISVRSVLQVARVILNPQRLPGIRRQQFKSSHPGLAGICRVGVALKLDSLDAESFKFCRANQLVTLRTEFILRLQRRETMSASYLRQLVHPAASTAAGTFRHAAGHPRGGAGRSIRTVGGKGGKLLLKLDALAGWALRLLGTVNDCFKLVPATFADVLENWH